MFVSKTSHNPTTGHLGNGLIHRSAVDRKGGLTMPVAGCTRRLLRGLATRALGVCVLTAGMNVGGWIGGLAVPGAAWASAANGSGPWLVQAHAQDFPAEVDAALSVWLDENKPLIERQQAATQLLDLPDGQGLAALQWVANQLAAPSAPNTTEPAGVVPSLAAAVVGKPVLTDSAAWTANDEGLSEVLWQIALATQTSNKTAVVEALVHLNAPSLPEAMRKTAQDAAQPIDRRVLACRVLSGLGTPQAFKQLAGLLADANPNVVQAANDNLTAMVGAPPAADGWAAWWAQANGWSDAQLAHWLTGQRAGLLLQTRKQQRQTVNRLVAALRETYWGLPNDQQPGKLMALMGDEMSSVRRLALELSRQRLADGVAFGPELLAVVRPVMADPEGDLRAGAAQLLTALKDGPAAQQAARRLVNQQEKDPSALSAMLRLLSRVPVAEAVSPAMALLEDPQVGADAASFLSAAADASFLNDGLRSETVQRVRTALAKQAAQPNPIRPQWLTLLAKVGDEADWSYIETLLDSANGDVRQAAATVWAATPNRPLTALARRGGDESLQTILYAAARQRGRTPSMLLELIGQRPGNNERVSAWFEAIAAVIGRVPAGDAIDAIDHYGRLHAEPTKQLLLITSVLANLPTRPADQALSPVEAELLARRAQIRFSQGKLAEALGDLEQALSSPEALKPVPRRQAVLTRAQCQFGLDQFDAGLVTLNQITQWPEVAESQVLPVVEAAAAAVQRSVVPPAANTPSGTNGNAAANNGESTGTGSSTESSASATTATNANGDEASPPPSPAATAARVAQANTMVQNLKKNLGPLAQRPELRTRVARLETDLTAASKPPVATTPATQPGSSASTSTSTPTSPPTPATSTNPAAKPSNGPEANSGQAKSAPTPANPPKPSTTPASGNGSA